MAGAFLSGAERAVARLQALQSQRQALRLVLRADNAFYSQRAALRARGLPVTRAGLAELPAFLAPEQTRQEPQTLQKTGLGSSASESIAAAPPGAPS